MVILAVVLGVFVVLALVAVTQAQRHAGEKPAATTLSLGHK